MTENRVKILMIEDNEADVRLIGEFLKDTGETAWDLVSASTLNEGLDLLGSEAVDLVLLDLGLPDSRGIGTFENLHESYPMLPIILLTGLDDRDLALKVIKAGAQDYLVKGNITPDFLHRAILYAMERKGLQEQLRERERFLSDIIDSIQDGIAILDSEMNIVQVNRAMTQLHDIEEPCIGRKCYEAFAGRDERCKNCPSTITLETGEPQAFTEYQAKTGNGKDRWFETVAFPLFEREGDKVSGVIKHVRDITERKNTEAELQKVSKLEGLGVLAGGIAHDFNNVLTGIMGNISIARITAGPGDKVQKTLLKAEKSCQVAAGLVQKLTPFARGGAPAKALVPMKIFIRESLRAYEVPPSIHIESSLEDDLWDAEVDSEQMKNVLLALVDNAVQASPEGSVIELKCENWWIGKGESKNLTQGPYVRLTVKDHGSGIDEKDHEKIFDPYFTTRDGADGLGLAIAYSVIKRHRGSITVRSKPESGTVFELFLPAKADEKARDDFEMTFPSGAGLRDGLGARENIEREGVQLEEGRKFILLMDDEKVILETAGQMLSIMGHAVSTARDGKETIAHYRKSLEEDRPFDVVILDLRVPGGMGGRETMGKLLEMDPDVTAVVSSGYSDDPIMAEYGKYGFKAAVAKPYNSGDLKRALGNALRNSDASVPPIPDYDAGE